MLQDTVTFQSIICFQLNNNIFQNSLPCVNILLSTKLRSMLSLTGLQKIDEPKPHPTPLGGALTSTGSQVVLLTICALTHALYAEYK